MNQCSYYSGYAFRRLRRHRRIKMPPNFLKALNADGKTQHLILRPDVDRGCILAHDGAYSGIMNMCADYDSGAERRHFGLAALMEVGIDDCITIPEPLADFCEIDDSVLIFAAGPMFEIWDPICFLQQPNLSQYELDLVLSLIDAVPSTSEGERIDRCKWSEISDAVDASPQTYGSKLQRDQYVAPGS